MSILKKGLVVVLASMFAVSVFASVATTTAPATAGATPAHAVVKHQKVMHCKKNKHGHCVKMHNHKKVMKKAEAAKAAK